VNADMLYAACERVLHDLETEPNDPYYAAGMQFNPVLAADPQQTMVSNLCKQILEERHPS